MVSEIIEKESLSRSIVSQATATTAITKNRSIFFIYGCELINLVDKTDGITMSFILAIFIPINHLPVLK